MYDDTTTLLVEIAAGEDSYLELKEIIFKGNQIMLGDAGKATSELAEVLCSMANSDGGIVLLGVRKDGTVIGITREKRDVLEQFVVNVALNNCRPLIQLVLDWVELPDEDGALQLCLKTWVKKSAYYVHRTSGGRYLGRLGTHRFDMPPEQLGRLLAARSLLIPFEERPALGQRLETIDRSRVDSYYSRRFGRSFQEDGLTFERLLVNFRLAVEIEGSVTPTNLGILLFCESPHRVLNGAYLDIAAYRHDVPDGETVDTKQLRGPLPEQIVQALAYFAASPLIATVSLKGEYGRTDRPAYVSTALQEATVNSVVHRDYEIAGSQIIIRLFPNRIEFQNPGGLHNSLTEEALYTGCQPVRRNQLLAGFMRDFPSPITGTSFMEARGEGFLNLVRDSQRLSDKRPEIRRIGDATKLTVFAAQHTGQYD